MACAWNGLLVKREKFLVAGRGALVKKGGTSNEVSPTSNPRPATSNAFLSTRVQQPSTDGFTLLPLVGILAIMTITASVLLPNMVTLQNQQTTNVELENLRAIAEGSELYLRKNLSWPSNLAAHSPDYVPLDSTQLLQNPRGYPRYFQVHPDTMGFNNQTGLAASDLSNARFLLISDLTQDVAPSIANATQFDTWWTTATTPDLNIYKANVANLFHEVNLTAIGDGGSYQIDGGTTNSGGGTLASYSRYHLRGTVVSLDEAPAFATPEVQFTLAQNVSYVFVPCLPSGKRWTTPPPPTCPVLWLSTNGNASGTPGLSEWTDAQVVAFVDPGLTYESGSSGSTNGNFGLVFDIEHFTGSADVDAIHYVTQPMTVGTTNTVSLSVGDLLLSTDKNETLTSSNSLSVRDEDVFVFRPDVENDYASGTFFMLIDGSDLPRDAGVSDIKGVSLVETQTVVGDATLQPGTFLLADENLRSDIYQFVPTSVGTSTSGKTSLFLDGSDIRLSENLSGMHLVQVSTNLGDVTLQSGQILLTMDRDDRSVGDNSIKTEEQDIFILDLKTTGSDTSGDATLLFDGSDVALQSGGEDLDGLTINGPVWQNSPLTIVNPGFETGDLTGWTKTGDLLDDGGINQWGAVTSASKMSSPHSGSYFAGGRATGAIGDDEHMTGLYQRIDVSAFASQIDNGVAMVNIAGFGHGETKQDRAFLRIAYYDAVSGGNQLGSDVNSNEATQSQTWTALAISGSSVPAGTRSIELYLLGFKAEAGSYLDVGIDDVSATLSYP